MNYEFEDKQYDGILDPTIAKAMQGYPKIFRLTNMGGSGRYYFTNQNGITVYNSGTTAIQHVDLTDGVSPLELWRRKLVMEGKNPAVELQKRANYGTIMHVLYGMMLMKEILPLSPVPLKELLIQLYEDKTIISSPTQSSESFAISNLTEFTKDIISFMKWIEDFKVEPLAIELMLKSDSLRVGTAIDLICRITHTTRTKGFYGEVYKADSKATGAKKGDPKESFKDIEVKETVVVDFKSGKKGFYPKHVLQLLTNKILMAENLPDLEISGYYNLAPVAWKTKPSYSFTNQDNATNKDEAKMRKLCERLITSSLEGGRVIFEDKILPKKFRVYAGDTTTDLDNVFKYMNITEFAAKQLAERFPDVSEFDRVMQTEGIEDTKTLKLYLKNSPDVHAHWLAEVLQEDLNHTDAQKTKFGNPVDYIIKNTKF